MHVSESSPRALGVLARVWLGLALSACGVAPEPSAASVDQQRAAVLPTNGVCPGLDGGSLSIPHHYCHVRIAQLAYYGVPTDAYMDDQLQNDVDLVVANDPAVRAHIDTLAPNTPQLVYSNASNLYGNWNGNSLGNGGLLVHWLNYGDAYAQAPENRESGFFHCDSTLLNTSNNKYGCQFSAVGQSTVPVSRFWQVKTGPLTGTAGFTDYTAAAHTTSTAVQFGTTGNALYIGHTDKFRQVIVTLSTASSGWTYQWQYWNGAAWTALTVSEPVGTWTTTGTARTLAFHPPSDWKATGIAGAGFGDRFFYVRVQTTAGTPPVAESVSSEDFVFTSGNVVTIPSFDGAADTNGDGYLNDTEWAARTTGKDARLKWWSRMFSTYGQMRYATNPNSYAFRLWSAWYHRNWLPTNAQADAVFMDNSGATDPYPNWPKAGAAFPFPTLECAVPCTGTSCLCNNYGTDYGKLIQKVDEQYLTSSAFTVLNTSGYIAGPNAALAQVQKGITYEEKYPRPVQFMANKWKEALQLTKDRASVTPRPHVIYDVLVAPPTTEAYCKTCGTGTGCPTTCASSYPAGLGGVTDTRTLMAVLASHYTLQDPELSFLDVNGGAAPASSWQYHFIPAWRYDIGTPDVDQLTWLTQALDDTASNDAVIVGNDPSPYNNWDASGCGVKTPAKYRLYKRVYTKGTSKVIVLFKSLSYHTVCTGFNGDYKQTHVGPTTATTFTWGSPLPATCSKLKPDGMVDTVSISGTTGVPIENAEGVILVCP
ncbi:hypothetical protein [Pyxidicoccus caerfyrddinensis]|uniref:hypothetical protein n=1 Tax=Pyxidicoccus caerfyrddinensis TaxID=2709663 RepID=UPI0013DAF672|nr:hypothetical protein [Pyxidicoccus caerfyrddinensis]